MKLIREIPQLPAATFIVDACLQQPAGAKATTSKKLFGLPRLPTSLFSLKGASCSLGYTGRLPSLAALSTWESSPVCSCQSPLPSQEPGLFLIACCSAPGVSLENKLPVNAWSSGPQHQLNSAPPLRLFLSFVKSLGVQREPKEMTLAYSHDLRAFLATADFSQGYLDGLQTEKSGCAVKPGKQ